MHLKYLIMILSAECNGGGGDSRTAGFVYKVDKWFKPTL